MRRSEKRSGAERCFYVPKRRAPSKGREGVCSSGVGVSVTSPKSTQQIPQSNTTHTHAQKKERPLFTGHGSHVRSSKTALVARGANARPGRAASKNKGGASTRASLAAPFQDTADGFRDAGGSGTTAGHGGPESHSFCTRRGDSYDERVVLDVAFSSLAAALGGEDVPPESTSVPRLLTVVCAQLAGRARCFR